MTVDSFYRMNDEMRLRLAQRRHCSVDVNRVTHTQARLRSQRQAGGRR